jgi:hypothetical protein
MKLQHSSKNVAFTARNITKFLPPIIEVKKPKSLAQKAAFWLANKLNLFSSYIPKYEIENYQKLEISDDAQHAISTAILHFMNNDRMLNPQRDLIILCNPTKRQELLFNNACDFIIHSQFARKTGELYKGIQIKCVSYVDGPLVLLRKDLQ